MIDFIKINNLNIGPRIKDRFDFEGRFILNSGEVLTDKKNSGYLRNLIFTIIPGGQVVKLQGSIHKYANSGKYNNDRFTLARFLNVANELKDYISSDDIINTLEFGINIRTPFDPSLFIKNIISHLKKSVNKKVTAEEVSSIFEYTHFLIKIYNKGLHQGPTGVNILRVEVKYLRMQKLFPSGLKWSDLANKDTWEYLGDIIRCKFSEIIYYDPSIDLDQVPERDRLLIEKGHNPIFWENLTGPHVSRIRKQYKNLIEKYGSTFNILPALLDQEIKEVVRSYQVSEQAKTTENLTEFNNMVKCYPLLYSNISPLTEDTSSTSTRYCVVTGIDISIQKPESKFLSFSGIRWLFMTDPLGYQKLKTERLSYRWLNASLADQFKEICHSIRNEYYNPGNNARRDVGKILAYPSLFDNLFLIKQSKLNLIR